MKFYLFIIILIYICCYFIFPPDILILQSNISDFNFSSLLTRQPIVLNDYLQEPEKLIQLWFNMNFKISINPINEWVQNKNKYLFINASNDTEIIIYKATIFSYIPNEDDKIIVIKLKKNQSLILPFRWNYYLNPNDVSIWGINDVITSFLFF
jgi:hypothetical protein